MRIKSTMNYVYVGDVPFDVFSLPYSDMDYVSYFDTTEKKVIFGEFEKGTYTKLVEVDTDNVDFIYTGEGAIFSNKDIVTTISHNGIEQMKNENEKFLDSCCGMVTKENGLLFFPVSGYMFNLQYGLKNKVVAHIYPLPIFFLSTKKHRITATKLLLLFNGIGIADTGVQNINEDIKDIAISFNTLTISTNQRIFKNLHLYMLKPTPNPTEDIGICISQSLIAIDKNSFNNSIRSVNTKFGTVSCQDLVIRLQNKFIKADKLIDNNYSIIIQSDYQPIAIIATPQKMEVLEDAEALGKISFSKALCN